MPAPKGNKYRLAIDNPHHRQLAFESYCDHIASGKVQDSWCYNEVDEDGSSILCCAKTMRSYIDKNPEEFPAIKLEVSKHLGYKRWESVVEASAEGTNEKANTASLQMLMRNKFGWDKKQEEQNVSAQAVDAFLGIMAQFADVKSSRSTDLSNKSTESKS